MYTKVLAKIVAQLVWLEAIWHLFRPKIKMLPQYVHISARGISIDGHREIIVSPVVGILALIFEGS